MLSAFTPPSTSSRTALPLARMRSRAARSFDEESEALGIRSAEDAMVLNIVTIHSMDPAFVTVNLAGPLVVNRSTLLGQQVILSGHNSYSTEHVLVGQQDVSPN